MCGSQQPLALHRAAGSRQHSATSGVVVAHPWSAASREHAPDVDRRLIDRYLTS
jgi:hypothetical protein